MTKLAKHPNGLTFLFFTEMWERFSFYGITGILVLYLTKHLNISDTDSSLVSGAYMAFTFLAPILGGYIADKFIGYVWSVSIGAFLIFLGNVILALPLNEVNVVYLGLAVVAVGTGFLKSTVSVLVGQLYNDNDSRRDSAYTIFYMGINLGSILAGFTIAYVAEQINWHYGFALAAIGMFLGLIIFWTGFKKGYFSEQSNVVKKDNLFAKYGPFNALSLLILGVFALTYILYYLLSSPGQTKIVITFISIALLGGLAVLAFCSKNKQERNQLLSILVFIITAIFFWSLYKQSFNSLAFFIDKDINRVFMGYEIPASMFVLVPNSIFIVLLASAFAKVWNILAAKGKNPSAPIKFLIGLIFTLASFSTFAFGAYLAHISDSPSAMFWPLLGIFLLTCAELCISPVGLSIVSKISPKRFSGLLMGAWFLGSSIGSYVSGLLSSLVHIPKTVTSVAVSSEAYFTLFYRCSIGMLVVIIIFIMFLPIMKKLSNGSESK